VAAGDERSGVTEEAVRFVPLGRCVVCLSESARERFVREDQAFGVPGRFRYCECTACGTVFQDPQVARGDIARLYPQTYYTHAPAPAPPAPPRPMGGARDRWRALLRSAVMGQGGVLGRALARSRALRQRAFFGLTDELIPRPGDRRALEVGPGAGELLALLVRAGWPEPEGVDFDPAAAERARARSGRPVRVAPFPDAELPSSAFDMVVLVHAFEHFPDPRAALARLRELLAPGGRAVVIGPNPRALGARVFDSSWVGWEAPRHLALPTIAALGAAAREAGLRLRSARTRTRFAEDFALSRAWKAGRSEGAIGARDRLWRALGSALARAGVEVGEEMVVVLERSE
jgi:SAM-dependent methyltransferase